MKNWLKNEYVVLSGASGGIGRELCKILVSKYDAKVVGIGRNEEKMRSLQKELGEKEDSFFYRLFDVGDRQGWVELEKWLSENGIHPKLLINNAGMFPYFRKALDTPSETVESVLQTNFLSMVYAIEVLSPILKGDKKNKSGIVNVSSSAGLCAVAGTAAYSASKAAVKAYTEALAVEQKGKKYVGVIHPGTTATELFDGDENTKNSALQRIAIPAQKMAMKIAKRILKRKRRSVLGMDAKLMNVCTKWMPVQGLFLVGGVMKASRSKVFSRVFEYPNRKDKNGEA
ncbi:MAG: SDR family NAD(P)-dependent oxidoreductase [Clostridia bacterium]|nr:SDR family NAD(P)-dependent oxidoreductase [Clostridia bacterium]